MRWGDRGVCDPVQDNHCNRLLGRLRRVLHLLLSDGVGLGGFWWCLEVLGAPGVLFRTAFPLLEGGNAVRFCLFVFSGLARCLLSFFPVPLFLGSLLGKIFWGANFCFGFVTL